MRKNSQALRQISAHPADSPFTTFWISDFRNLFFELLLKKNFIFIQEDAMSQMNLRQLAPGQKASIVKITAHGELGRRIRDMGLVPGMSVQVVGKAPLRDPVALRIEGSTIALRNSEADFVSVEVK